VAHEDVRAFTEEVLRTGLVLIDLLSTLVDDLPDDAFPGEEPAKVLVDMLAGSMQPAADAAGAEAVLRGTALVGALLDRALADVQTAAKMARGS